jgi:hypothetical protein
LQNATIQISTVFASLCAARPTAGGPIRERDKLLWYEAGIQSVDSANHDAGGFWKKSAQSVEFGHGKIIPVCSIADLTLRVRLGRGAWTEERGLPAAASFHAMDEGWLQKSEGSGLPGPQSSNLEKTEKPVRKPWTLPLAGWPAWKQQSAALPNEREEKHEAGHDVVAFEALAYCCCRYGRVCWCLAWMQQQMSHQAQPSRWYHWLERAEDEEKKKQRDVSCRQAPPSLESPTLDPDGRSSNPAKTEWRKAPGGCRRNRKSLPFQATNRWGLEWNWMHGMGWDPRGMKSNNNNINQRSPNTATALSAHHRIIQ